MTLITRRGWRGSRAPVEITRCPKRSRRIISIFADDLRPNCPEQLALAQCHLFSHRLGGAFAKACVRHNICASEFGSTLTAPLTHFTIFSTGQVSKDDESRFCRAKSLLADFIRLPELREVFESDQNPIVGKRHFRSLASET